MDEITQTITDQLLQIEALCEKLNIEGQITLKIDVPDPRIHSQILKELNERFAMYKHFINISKGVNVVLILDC